MMDRVSWIGLVACVALYFGWMTYVRNTWPPKETEVPVGVPDNVEVIPAEGDTASSAQPAASSATTNATAPEATPDTPVMRSAEGPVLGGTGEATVVDLGDLPSEKTLQLSNDDQRVTFTSNGGAIKTIELLKHPDEGDLVVSLNHASAIGVFNITGWEGDAPVMPFELRTEGDTVVATRQLADGLTVTRTYRLLNDYQIEMRQVIANPGGAAASLPGYDLNLGTAAPTSSFTQPHYIVASWLTANGDYRQHSVQSFDPSHFIIEWSPARDFISSPPNEAPLGWAAVENQFYVMVTTPPDKDRFAEVTANPVLLPKWGGKGSTVPRGIHARAHMAEIKLAAGASQEDVYTLYAGPKEYGILSQFDRQQDLIMHFGMFWWVIIPLLGLMNWIHGLFGHLEWGWGWTIIATTVIIKSVLWPLNSVANRSMKRMQALQPKVNSLREKYKEDPQKMNTEMMALYRDYGVNPIGGCLPMLAQMPIFISFYFLLQSAVELRGQHFLWIHDLTRPDTVAVIAGIPINPLPLIMTCTTFVLMRMTPQAQDNPQMKVMQFMPLLFLVILYNFASALALYWTVNNLISIVQNYINLRRPIPELKRIPRKKAAAWPSAGK